MKRQDERRRKRIWRDSSGVTMVELVVTFALIAIFMVGASRILADSIRTYDRMRGTNYAIQVADTLLEKIVGELEHARPGDPSGIEIKADGIAFPTPDGGRRVLSAGDGYLSARTGADSGKDSLVYDPRVYMGFRIGELAFSPVSDEVVQVKLTLESDHYGSYQAARCAEFCLH